jgi:hypothetical protein
MGYVGILNGNLVYFCGLLVYFTVIWSNLRLFGTFFRFGTLYQEKSGNTDWDQLSTLEKRDHLLVILLLDCISGEKVFFTFLHFIRNFMRERKHSGRKSYDFGIYNYNASVVKGKSVFRGRRKYACFQNTLCR